jgi:SAM-dependent methyltransferase
VLKTWKLPLFPLIVARESLTRGERPREPEPMVMDEAEGVAEYDEAGAGVQVPVHHLNALAMSRLLPQGGSLLDLGCGTARLLARLARGRPDLEIIGLDLSEPMLETGRRLLADEGLADRVELRRGDITAFDAEVPERLDLVSCNFALHHLPSEDHVSGCFEAIARARERTGCGAYIFDFARLRNAGSWPAMMSMLEAPGAVFVRDGIASERASFTFAELTDLLSRAGLGDLHHRRARPLGEFQIHWAVSRDGGPPGSWQQFPLPSGTGLATRIVLSSFPRSLTRQ